MQWMVATSTPPPASKGWGIFSQGPARVGYQGVGIKPEYTGDGLLVLEPTYKHILLLDLLEWNGSIVLDDGLFLACDANLKHKAVMRSNLSSAVAGNEGLFNLGLVGQGVVCLESECPREELIEVTLQNDVLRSTATWLWLERQPGLHRGAVGETLVGSAASGEGW